MTPGPWKRSRGFIYHEIVRGEILTQEFVADSSLSNANLILAAPDMLALLIKIHNQVLLHDDTRRWVNADETGAVIAKAMANNDA